MGKSRKKCGCDSSIPVIDPCNVLKSRNTGGGKFPFPTDIKSLLILIAEDDDPDNRVDIILDACSNHCLIEDARPIAVMDNTLILKDGDGCGGKYRYVCIACICEVIVDCDTILQELFEEHSYNRE